MILDGVISNFKEVALQNLAIGGMGAIAATGLAVAGATFALPIVAGFAGGLSIAVTANHFKSFIQNKIFINRVEKIEQFAKKNNVNPDEIPIKFNDMYVNGNIEKTKYFKHLIRDKEESKESTNSNVTMTKEQFHEAMETIKSKALQNDGFKVTKPDINGIRSKFFTSENKSEFKPK